MSVLGDIEPFDQIIFADLGWERITTYETVKYYTKYLTERGANVISIKTGDIRVDGAEKEILIPFYTNTGGMLRRQCTYNLKIQPIRQQMRKFAGFPIRYINPGPKQFKLIMGISYDEYTRMRDSSKQYIVHEYPLIDRKITREDCIEYIKNKGLLVPQKSSCIMCPYRPIIDWKNMKETCIEDFNKAVEFDENNRNNPLAKTDKVKDSRLYIYNSYKEGSIPLKDANLDIVSNGNIEICENGYCHT